MMRSFPDEGDVGRSSRRLPRIGSRRRAIAVYSSRQANDCSVTPLPSSLTELRVATRSYGFVTAGPDTVWVISPHNNYAE